MSDEFRECFADRGDWIVFSAGDDSMLNIYHQDGSQQDRKDSIYFNIICINISDMICV